MARPLGHVRLGIATLFVPLGRRRPHRVVDGERAGEPVGRLLHRDIIFALASPMFGAFEIALPAS